MKSKILGSVLVMGMAIVLAGAGTMAYFSDTETSTGNTFTAGTLDLKIDFDSTYNGEADQFWEMKDLDGEKFFDLDDIKPGDEGQGKISVHVEGNPAHLWMCIENVVENENGMNEPENEVDETPDVGELAQNIMVEAWVDLNEDGILDADENCHTTTLADLAMGMYMGVIDNCTTYNYYLDWWVPSEVGNCIQSDSVTFDIVFYAEQTRHNPYPDGPCGCPDGPEPVAAE